MIFLSGGPGVPAGQGRIGAGQADPMDCGVM
jgi:hypothetical protein